MILRELGLRVQELETGPLSFLIVDSQPVAYCDRSIGAWFRAQEYVTTDRYQGKGITKALNKWLKNHEVTSVPRSRILEAFQGVSRYASESLVERRREGRRSDDAVDPKVTQLAKALVEIMGNGKP
jgi:hypothetical protein